jgi:hypothetical protein
MSQPDQLQTVRATVREPANDIRPVFPILEYWLVTQGEDGGYTPFQGFGLDIAKPEFPTLIELLATLPASAAEVFAPPEDLASLRRPLPTKTSSIVGLPTLRALQQSSAYESAIPVVLGLPEVIAVVRTFLHNPSAIFVSTSASQGVVGLEGYRGHWAQLLDVHIRDAVASRLSEPEKSVLLRTPLRSAFAPGTTPSRIAGVTAPNECVSGSLGFAYSGSEPIDGRQDGAYVDAIIESANNALTLIGDESTDVILYAPSIMRELYAFGGAFWNNIFRRIRSSFIRQFIKDGVFRNKGYSGYQVKLEASPAENPYQDPIAGPVLMLRQTELRLSSMGVAALASSCMQPALRLPNAVNFHAADLREIEQHAQRGDARGRRLLQASYKMLANKLASEVDGRIISYLRDRAEAITVVADAPLEWMRIDGLPLMIRHEVSRIGMTPGNLMLAQCIESRTLTLPSEALLRILVVRSFSKADRVRPVLEAAAGIFNLQRVRLTFVDVDSLAELIVTLNSFDGAIVVFDCHGGHGGATGHGWLQVGADKVDTWQLAHIARVPPIVILSACSTFALAGSHASVGNGLIRSGAVTVIGTLLPVDAVKSATFVARLLYRIDAFLPALQALDKNFVTWRVLVSTFFRMSYSTDVLRFFIDEKQWIPDSAFRDIGVVANYEINALRPDWHSRFIDRIAQSAQRTPEEVLQALDSEAPLQETMYYCQIGRPERIGIYLGEASRKAE